MQSEMEISILNPVVKKQGLFRSVAVRVQLMATGTYRNAVDQAEEAVLT